MTTPHGLLVLVFLLEEAPTVHPVAPATDPFSPVHAQLFFPVGPVECTRGHVVDMSERSCCVVPGLARISPARDRCQELRYNNAVV